MGKEKDLEHILSGKDRDTKIGVLPHDNPDPDSEGTALNFYYKLNKLGFKNIEIIYSGNFLFPENKTMKNKLQIPLTNYDKNPSAADKDYYILIDHQGGSNCNLFSSGLGDFNKVLAVIDHHDNNQDLSSVPFVDIRNYGACSTIFAQYMKNSWHKDFNEEELRNISTALYLGIYFDTSNLDVGKGATWKDYKAMEWASHYIDEDKVHTIQNAPRPKHWKKKMRKVRSNCREIGDVIVAETNYITKGNTGPMAEAADGINKEKGPCIVLGYNGEGVYACVRGLQDYRFNELKSRFSNGGGGTRNGTGKLFIPYQDIVPGDKKDYTWREIHSYVNSVVNKILQKSF